jgi:hypothetical protein
MVCVVSGHAVSCQWMNFSSRWTVSRIVRKVLKNVRGLLCLLDTFLSTKWTSQLSKPQFTKDGSDVTVRTSVVNTTQLLMADRVVLTPSSTFLQQHKDYTHTHKVWASVYGLFTLQSTNFLHDDETIAGMRVLLRVGWSVNCSFCIIASRLVSSKMTIYLFQVYFNDTGHGSRAVWGINCLRSLGRCDRGFESHLGHGCLVCVCVCVCENVYSVFVLPCI